jgi:hypothetical protein
MHSSTLFAVLAGATAVAAQIFPGIDPSTLDIETKGHDATHTTYVINCGSAIAQTDCPFPTPGATFVQGKSTMDLYYSAQGESLSVGCQYIGTTAAACVVSDVSGGTSFAVTTTVAASQLPVLPAAATGSATTDAATGASPAATTATATATATATTGATTLATTASSSSKTTGSASGATQSASHSSNAGMPQVTGNAGWAVGGVAMALALAIV